MVPVSGLLQGTVSVRLLLVLRVGFLRTYVRTVIQSVWVWSVWGSVQRGTYASVGLRSSIGQAAWFVVVHPRSLSEQPVLPELLADSAESGVVV